MTNFLSGAGSHWTKSSGRFEYNYLNNSKIQKKSNVNHSIAFRQISVQGDFFCGRPSCFPFSFSSEYAFLFFQIKF